MQRRAFLTQLVGVPAVMGNYYGKNIGVVDLTLSYADGHWQVNRAASHAEVRSVKNADDLHAKEEFEMYREVVRELGRRLDEMQRCYE